MNNAFQRNAGIMLLASAVFIDVSITMHLIELSIDLQAQSAANSIVVTNTGSGTVIQKQQILTPQILKSLLLIKSALLYAIFGIASNRLDDQNT